MDEAKGIVRLNIEHYRRLLATETDPGKLKTVAKLLAEQEAKLQEMERKERETTNRQLAEQEARLLQEMERKKRGDEALFSHSRQCVDGHRLASAS